MKVPTAVLNPMNPISQRTNRTRAITLRIDILPPPIAGITSACRKDQKASKAGSDAVHDVVCFVGDRIRDVMKRVFHFDFEVGGSLFGIGRRFSAAVARV